MIALKPCQGKQFAWLFLNKKPVPCFPTMPEDMLATLVRAFIITQMLLPVCPAVTPSWGIRTVCSVHLIDQLHVLADVYCINDTVPKITFFAYLWYVVKLSPIFPPIVKQDLSSVLIKFFIQMMKSENVKRVFFSLQLLYLNSYFCTWFYMIWML